jgi:hypothetical protein
MMTTLSYPAIQYRIVLRGECGLLLAGIADELAVESSGGRTRVVVSVRDESEFYGLLDRLHDLALHIISLSELGANRPDPRGVTGN